MRLIATQLTQGSEADDFFFAEEGEEVREMLYPGRCTTPGCGCDHALAGVKTAKGTTSFMVVPGICTDARLRAAIDSHIEGEILGRRGGAFYVRESRPN